MVSTNSRARTFGKTKNRESEWIFASKTVAYANEGGGAGARNDGFFFVHIHDIGRVKRADCGRTDAIQKEKAGDENMAPHMNKPNITEPQKQAFYLFFLYRATVRVYIYILYTNVKAASLVLSKSWVNGFPCCIIVSVAIPFVIYSKEMRGARLANGGLALVRFHDVGDADA